MKQFAQYYAIQTRLKKQGFDPDKSELVSDFTNGKKNGLSALTPWEYAEFIKWLNRTYPSGYTPEQIRANRMRKKIISLFMKMGYIENHRPDMDRIYDWVLKYGSKNKPLNDYSVTELPALISQVEIMYKKFLLS